MTEYTSLHNLTHYSILNALPSPKDYFVRAKELGQTAIAITDRGSLAGAWEALKAAKDTGIKLIIGCEFYFVDDVANKDGKLRFIVLLAKNEIGYRNILALNKLGFENSAQINKKVFPVIDWNFLKAHADGIVCLTGCGSGIIGQLLNNKRFEDAESSLVKLRDIYGSNLGIEIQAHNLQRGATYYSDSVDQSFTNNHLIRLAKKHGIRIVPTTNSYYIKKEDASTHDVMLAIGAMQPVYSNARIKYNVSDLYLKSGDEIKTFFSRNQTDEFIEEICANSVYFANLCEDPKWIDPRSSNPDGKELPVFPVQDEADYVTFSNWRVKRPDLKDLEIDKAYLRFKCEDLLLKKIPADKVKQYRIRLEEELDVFYHCGVSSYMLIVADYVSWAGNNGVSTGPGRGSAGGSLVAYLLGIQHADPIKYGLIFPRFFSKLRASYADIDLDFSKNGRHKVLEYIQTKYGKENFAQITNFNYITPKVYVRDISRSCELGGDRKSSVELGDNIADIIPKIGADDREIRTYKDITNNSPLFTEYAKKYTQLNDCNKICNKPRSLGIHAAGVIVSKRPLSSIVPIRIDKDDILSIQMDKNTIEDIGLVKMDILGLETLDIIEEVNKLITKNGKQVPVIDCEIYDAPTYDLISSGDTYGVFQFGTSAGTIDLCKKIQPKTLEDLAVITTLARPASKDIREEFIVARAGKKRVKLLHESLNNALKDTYGFPLYDESLLVLAKDVAGWELDEADKLRKLTKEKGKNPEKAEKWRLEFIEGAFKNGVPKDIAINIWHDIIEPFGKYSFNKSLYQYEAINTYTSEGVFTAQKPIKDIEVGEFVRSRDEISGHDIFVKVNGKYDHGVLPLVEVELTTGERVRCTMNHKFRVKENGEMLPLWKIVKEGLTIIVDTAYEGTERFIAESSQES